MSYKSLLNVQHKVTVTPTLTAKDWQLCTITPGAEEVAQSLNGSLAYAVDLDEGREYTEKFMGLALRPHDIYGAFDDKTRGVLQALLDTIYAES